MYRTKSTNQKNGKFWTDIWRSPNSRNGRWSDKLKKLRVCNIFRAMKTSLMSNQKLCVHGHFKWVFEKYPIDKESVGT